MDPLKDSVEIKAKRYENWFEKNPHAYSSEVEAIRQLLPPGEGVEMGVGSGRFAGPLGIKVGVELFRGKGEVARTRGIRILEGSPGNIPLPDDSLDFVLMVNSICFVGDLELTLAGARRIIRPGGALVVGMVDRNSHVGEMSQGFKDRKVYYKVANFLSVDEVTGAMTRNGFKRLEFVQTVFTSPGEMTSPDPVTPGYGDGSFVVIRGWKEIIKED